MIVAVDFDNTLALGNYGHISILAPNRDLIRRLQDLRRGINPKIIIVTARGSKAGLSNEQKEKQYVGQISAWLEKYGVPYDAISFNKEYANIYIDDQTICPQDEFQFEQSAFTGNKIIFTKNSVIKTCDSAAFEMEWYKEARMRGFDVPDVLFCNDSCIITRRIYGWTVPTDANIFIQILRRFKEIGTLYTGGGWYGDYFNNLPKKIEFATQKTMDCVDSLPGFAHFPTFFHGDLSTTNVLCRDGIPYLIDPNVKHIFGSYLTDAGKAVFSLIAYEAKFLEAQKIVDAFGPEVWYFAVAEGLRVCKYQPKYISIVNNIADLI